MKKSLKALYKMRYLPLLLVPLLVTMMVLPSTLMAATTPGLGQADSFAILSSTYTNTAIGTTISGDLGYTTGPAVAPTVNGVTFSPPSIKYNQAGIDQNAALSILNGEAPTFTFANGAIDLATDTTHGTIGIYAPGVYLINGAASIGTGGITLNGSGTYIFQIKGALTTVANSVVTLSGASPCDVFWVPTEATTLGANSTFKGTDIDAAGITILSTINWQGRALAFGGTVSTVTDTLTILPCSTSSPDSATAEAAAAAAAAAAAPAAAVASSAVYTITASTEGNGSMTLGNGKPAGVFSIASGQSIDYIMKPNEGASIVDVLVNGVSVGAVPYYVFLNVTSNQTIHAIFSVPTTTTAQETATAETTTTTPAPITTTVTGGQIPKTSTPWYNVLVVGVALTLIGAVGWLIIRKRAR